jgi:predicted metal-dependent peptidase
MVEYAPGTGGLALWIRHVDDDTLASGLEAANDGHTIRYGPAFEQLTLERQTGLVAHQVLHVALRHAQRGRALARVVGDVDAQLFNACADAIVNSALDHLGWLELPAGAIRLDRLLSRVLSITEPVDKSLLEWDLERLYRTVDDRRRRGGGRSASSGGGQPQSRQQPQRPRDGGEQGGSGEGGPSARARAEQRSAGASEAGEPQRRDERREGAGGGEAGEAAAAGGADGLRAQALRALVASAPQDLLSPAADAPEQESEQAREWRERLLRAHAGDGAHSMLRQLLADLPEVRIAWESVLRSWLTRGLTPLPSPSWSRPARSWLANQGRSASGRRLPWEPGTASSRAVARLAVMIDVSGSIDEGLLARFAREITAITRRTEAELTLIVGDDRVRHVERIDEGRWDLSSLKVEGGGGTDFSPLLEEAQRRGADIGVVLTDLDGPSDFKPSFPVMWAVPASCREFREPFGRRLELQ